MAVYTQVSQQDLDNFLKNYEIGSLESFNGISAGVENTNYKIRTNKGLYILTLYEKRVDKKDIPFFLELMFYLSNEKIHCPLPLKNRNGKLFDELNSRPASILTFLEGSSTETIYPKQVNTLGKILAKIHILGKQLKIKRKNPLSLGNLESLITLSKKNSENIRNDLSKEIVSEYYRVRSNWPDNLPKGIIHADLFPDNVLFIGNEISGVIDFCFSCNDFLSYDLATCLNAWCFDKEGILDLNLSSELINGYQSLRKLEENEINFFPIICSGSALRFLVTRINDWKDQRSDAVVIPKDPMDFVKILDFHKNVKDAKEYGLIK